MTAFHCKYKMMSLLHYCLNYCMGVHVLSRPDKEITGLRECRECDQDNHIHTAKDESLDSTTIDTGEHTFRSLSQSPPSSGSK